MLVECVKTTILLVCSICTVHRFFFLVIDLCSFFYNVFALFIQRFSLFIYSSILVSHFVFFFLFLNSRYCSYSTKWHCSYSNYFFFFVFYMYFFFPFIYITVHPVFLYCTSTVPFCWVTLSFFFSFFLVLNSSYNTKLIYSTLLSQNSLFCIQFFWVAFLYIFFFTHYFK